MDKKTEALKLALEALETCERHGYMPVRLTTQAITAIREALAEQPAQQQMTYQQGAQLINEMTAQQDSTCNKKLREQGKAYPRTCKKCGLGPCIADRVQPAQQQEPLLQEIARLHDRIKDLGWDVEFLSRSASKPLTDEQILNLVPGLQDCLCDPWDYNNSGDYYASIPKDMIRLARAVEAAHGIKEKNA